MKRLAKFGWALLFAVSVISCGDPYEAPLPTDPAKKIEFYKLASSLPSEEQKDLQDYLTRMTEEKLAGGPGAPAGITVRQALEAQRAWKVTDEEKKKAEREANEKAAAERDAKRQADLAKAQTDMLAACSADLVNMKVVSGVVGKSFDMQVKFSNKSDKELMLVMGTLQLADASGKLLKEVKIPYMKSLKPGKSATSGGKIPFIADREGDAILAKTPLKKIQEKWIPVYLKFADGSTVGEEPKPDKRRR